MTFKSLFDITNADTPGSSSSREAKSEVLVGDHRHNNRATLDSRGHGHDHQCGLGQENHKTLRHETQTLVKKVTEPNFIVAHGSMMFHDEELDLDHEKFARIFRFVGLFNDRMDCNIQDRQPIADRRTGLVEIYYKTNFEQNDAQQTTNQRPEKRRLSVLNSLDTMKIVSQDMEAFDQRYQSAFQAPYQGQKRLKCSEFEHKNERCTHIIVPLADIRPGRSISILETLPHDIRYEIMIRLETFQNLKHLCFVSKAFRESLYLQEEQIAKAVVETELGSNWDKALTLCAAESILTIGKYVNHATKFMLHLMVGNKFEYPPVKDDNRDERIKKLDSIIFNHYRIRWWVGLFFQKYKEYKMVELNEPLPPDWNPSHSNYPPTETEVARVTTAFYNLFIHKKVTQIGRIEGSHMKSLDLTEVDDILLEIARDYWAYHQTLQVYKFLVYYLQSCSELEAVFYYSRYYKDFLHNGIITTSGALTQGFCCLVVFGTCMSEFGMLVANVKDIMWEKNSPATVLFRKFVAGYPGWRRKCQHLRRTLLDRKEHPQSSPWVFASIPNAIARPVLRNKGLKNPFTNHRLFWTYNTWTYDTMFPLNVNLDMAIFDDDRLVKWGYHWPLAAQSSTRDS